MAGNEGSDLHQGKCKILSASSSSQYHFISLVSCKGCHDRCSVCRQVLEQALSSRPTCRLEQRGKPRRRLPIPGQLMSTSSRLFLPVAKSGQRAMDDSRWGIVSRNLQKANDLTFQRALHHFQTKSHPKKYDEKHDEGGAAHEGSGTGISSTSTYLSVLLEEAMLFR